MQNFPAKLNDKKIIENANELVIYMQRQWINNRGPVNIWNFNRLARTRSTNPAEAFHSMIKRDPSSVRCASLVTFLSFFQTIMAESDDRITKILGGKMLPRGRDPKYEQLDNRIIQTLDEYEVELYIKKILFNLQENVETHVDDFEEFTLHILDRLSYLMLEMDTKGLKTIKQSKIESRKRKIIDESDIETTTNVNRLQILSSDENEEIIEDTDEELLLEPCEDIVLEQDEGIIEEEGATDITVTRELARATIRILFNPPNLADREAFCDRWDYQLGTLLYFLCL